MDMLIDLARHASGHQLDMWAAIGAALVLAWLDRNRRMGGSRRYDAWWAVFLPPSDTKGASRRRPR